VHPTIRAGHRVRRSLGLLAAGALALTMAPVASAGARPRSLETPTPPPPPRARGIDEICDGPTRVAFADIGDSAHEEAILCLADLGLTEGTSNPSLYAPAVR
jgi:hypothetical protein